MHHPDSHEEFLSQVGVYDESVEVVTDPLDMNPRPVGIAPPSKKQIQDSLQMVSRSLDKRRSMIWKYFSPPFYSSDHSSCHACRETFKGPPSILIQHLKSRHPDIYADYAQSTLMVIRQSIGCDLTEGGEAIEEPVSTVMPHANEVVHQELKSKNSSLSFLFETLTEASNGFYCKICPSSLTFNLNSASDMMEHLELEHSSLYKELTEICFEKDHRREQVKVKQERIFVSGEEEHEVEVDKVYDSDDETLRQSKVWLYFEPTEMDGFYSCNLCSSVFKCKKNPASVVFRHMKMAHPNVYLSIKNIPVEEEANLDVDEDYHYLVDLFSPVEHDQGLQECKACLKTFREENVVGQMEHIKKEHPKLSLTPSVSSVSYTVSQQRGNYKRRSFIWKYFDVTNIEGENSCKTCKKVFKCKGQSTSSMIRHLKFGHKDIYDEFYALTESFHGRKIGVPSFKYAPPVKTQMEVREAAPSAETEEEEEDDNTPSVEMDIGASSQEEATPQDSPNVPLGRRRSSIWNYFVTTDVPDVNACKICHNVFRCKSKSTSSMIRHLMKKHLESFNEYLRFKDLPREVQSKTVDESELKSFNPIWCHFTRCKGDPKWGECNQCDQKVKTGPEKGKVPNLIRHLEVNHPDNYETYLISGGRTELEEQSQTCRECGDNFPNRSSLREHSKSAHPKSSLYKCNECDATFNRRDLFEAHTHGKERPRNFLCIVCGKTFARRSIRNFHEKAHKNEKNYQCGYCPKKFLTNQRKYKHERTHTGERPYQCTECGRQFTQSHHLVTHSRIHTGQKPYTCNFCPQKFRHLSSRNNHKCEGKLGEGGSQTRNSSQ